MKLFIWERFGYELHVVYCYFMFHLKLDLYVSAFPTIVEWIFKYLKYGYLDIWAKCQK